jgi:hypothetical protein
MLYIIGNKSATNFFHQAENEWNNYIADDYYWASQYHTKDSAEKALKYLKEDYKGSIEHAKEWLKNRDESIIKFKLGKGYNKELAKNCLNILKREEKLFEFINTCIIYEVKFSLFSTE